MRIQALNLSKNNTFQIVALYKDSGVFATEQEEYDAWQKLVPHLTEISEQEANYFRELPIYREEKGKMDRELEGAKGSIPLGRIGAVDDIANTVLFLASDYANYITGQVVCVDGGMSI